MKQKQIFGTITWCVASLLLIGTGAQAITIDFETDDYGTPLVNGQSISTHPDIQDLKGNNDTVFEFGRLVEIRTTPQSVNVHEGAAIFDSASGVNWADPDLQVNLGNVLILQNDDNPGTTLDATYGLVFNTPNDERSFSDAGSIIFDFTGPVELISIDLIDIDQWVTLTLTLTDSNDKERVYDVGSNWTSDVSVSGDGWETLYLNTLANQPADSFGGPATASEDAGFNALNVVQLEVAYSGCSISSGIDNLTFVPEPATLGLLVVGGVILLMRKR